MIPASDLSNVTEWTSPINGLATVENAKDSIAIPAASQERVDTENHKDYFWTIVRFKVGNSRFQLPLHRFAEESDVFVSNYGLLNKPAKEGVLNSFIKLDVELEEFECFLKALIPQCTSSSHNTATLSKQEWISVLKLSTKWRFNRLRKMAIEALEATNDLPALEYVTLGKEYDIAPWILSGYAKFTEDKALRPWTKDDASRIGADTVRELQNIVIARYDPASHSLPLGSIKNEILRSPTLKEEYDATTKRMETYLTVEDLRRIEEERIQEKRARKVLVKAERKKLIEKEEERVRRLHEERARRAREHAMEVAEEELRPQSEKKQTEDEEW